MQSRRKWWKIWGKEIWGEPKSIFSGPEDIYTLKFLIKDYFFFKIDIKQLFKYLVPYWMIFLEICFIYLQCHYINCGRPNKGLALPDLYPLYTLSRRPKSGGLVVRIVYAVHHVQLCTMSVFLFKWNYSGKMQHKSIRHMLMASFSKVI